MRLLPREHPVNPQALFPKGGRAFCFGGHTVPDPTETLDTLLRRYSAEHDEPRDVPRVSLTDALRSGDDPLHILPYLAGLGFAVRTLDDLLLVNDDDTEEEVHSFRVAEGVAVTLASDGLWLLFEP